MGADPDQSAWNANKAIDGNPSQDYKSNSCAITDVEGKRNTSIWWKVWLQKQFNVAYLEIYFRSDSEFTKIILILVHKRIHIYIHLQIFFLISTFRAAIAFNSLCYLQLCFFT